VIGSVALLAGYVGERFSRSPKAQRIMNYMAGTVLGGLAINLVLAKHSSVGA
jgi:threonine/homoserine/homoserine lactone efflux protein